MSFNDYPLLTDKDYSILKTNYEKVYSNEVSDIQEIIEKMQEQKANLIENNPNGRYNQVIEKISSNISELQSLIKSNTNPSNDNHFHQASNIASMLNSYKNRTIAQQLDEPSGAIHPVHSIDEMTRHNDLSSSTPLDANIPSNEHPLSPSPAKPNGTNIIMRNRPMQMGFITNFIKSLKVGFNSHRARKRALNSEINYTLTMHRNKFHNTQNVHTTCDPHNKLVTNQIDIIRLLLLYLALRPTCRYCSRIASIANEQFDLLLTLGITNQ